MRRLLMMSVVVLLAGVVVSLPLGSASVARGRWVPREIKQFDWDYITGSVAINERGQVLGVTGDQMALWQNGSIRELGLTASGDNYPSDVNDQGLVVGSAVNGNRIQAFVWADGRTRFLGNVSPADEFSDALGINNKGLIVGTSGRKAVMWWRGKALPLATPPTVASRATAVNERGTTVGSIGDGNAERAAVWQAGKLRVLPSLGGASEASDINERGQIVGWSKTGDGKYHAVLWQSGRVRKLDRRFDDARSINDAGVIVGSCGDSACVWEAGRLTNLGKIISSSFAVDVNSRRTIVGNVHDSVGGPCCYSVYMWSYRTD